MNLAFLKKDPKTTITALVGGIATLLSIFHVIALTIEAQAPVITITIILIGIFAKDGSTGLSDAEKADLIAGLKQDAAAQPDPGAAASKPTITIPGKVFSILLLVASLFLFPMIQSCATMGTTGQPSFQEQWNSLTPDQKARVTLNGIQTQLNQQFDTAKAYVTANPQYKDAWQKEVVPIFDKANKAVKAMIDTAMISSLTADQVYLKIQPMINELALKLISMGMQKGGLIDGSDTFSSYAGSRIGAHGDQQPGRNWISDLAAVQTDLWRSDSILGKYCPG
jgi:hypothetical protein